MTQEVVAYLLRLDPYKRTSGGCALTSHHLQSKSLYDGEGQKQLRPWKSSEWRCIFALQGFKCHFPSEERMVISAWKKKKKKILVRLHLMHGTGPWAPSSRVSQQEWTLLYGGSPTLLILMIVRVLYLVQTCLELQKQLQGVARCTKKITLKTVQIGIIYRELKKGIQE